MKNLFIYFMALMLFPLLGITQTIDNVDFIAPFHDDLSAVRKGDQWAFINNNGEKVIDFRNDLVLNTNINSEIKKTEITKNYPYFSNGRCLINQEKEGITYYGFIDKSGAVVIEPNYINATVFENGYAIVLKLFREELNSTTVLNKRIVKYSYTEVIIDAENNFVSQLRGPVNLAFSEERMKNPPLIQSYLLSSSLAAMKAKNGKWRVYNLHSNEL